MTLHLLVLLLWGIVALLSVAILCFAVIGYTVIKALR